MNIQKDKTESIKNQIDKIISLTEEEFTIFINYLELKKLSKNDFFLKEGNICNYIGFINYGALIYFKTLENGDEVTIHFAFDGDWVNNNISRLNNTPSAINIKAIEETEVLILKQEYMSKLYIQIPKFERLGRILTEQSFIKFVEQTIDFQILTAKERYENLLKRCPEIFQKVQLYHIANYLGIAPKSLSRIRKEILDK